jgi:hypothetical protein
MTLPENCIQQNVSCNILLTATPVIDTNGSVQFELFGRVRDKTRWFAMGLSFDEEMGDDSVTEILISNDAKEIRQSWNDEKSNQLIPNVKGIEQIAITLTDGFLSGKWRRDALTIVKDKHFDILNDKFYILLAEGPLDAKNSKFLNFKLQSIPFIVNSKKCSLAPGIHYKRI